MELEIIGCQHEKVKTKFKNIFLKTFEDVMITVALELGMRDGRPKFCYRDIAKHVMDNPNYYTICRMSYIMRGMFERHHRWKIKIEEKLMKQLGFSYCNGFKSSGKNYGCFCNLISEVITNKHRDINTRIKLKHGFRIVQRSKVHVSNFQGRLRSDNKNFLVWLKTCKRIVHTMVL